MRKKSIKTADLIIKDAFPQKCNFFSVLSVGTHVRTCVYGRYTLVGKISRVAIL